MITRDEIIKLAWEAGFQPIPFGIVEVNLLSFAALVAAAEREACASICDRLQARDVGMQPAECAAAIRAKREK